MKSLALSLALLPSLLSAEEKSDVSFPNTITKIAFGSCHKMNPKATDEPIFDAVVAQKPDVFIFLGDNIYGDTNDMKILEKKICHPRSASRISKSCGKHQGLGNLG